MITVPAWPRPPFLLEAGGLGLTLNADELTLWHVRRDQRLVIVPLGTPPFCPVLAGTPGDFRLTGTEQDGNAVRLTYDSPTLGSLSVRFDGDGDALVVSSRFIPKADCELVQLSLLPEGTALNLYDLVNFRNRHHTPHTWPELLLGGRCETTTYSDDWQFAPHPTQFILRKGDAGLLVGAMDLPHAFGMYVSVENARVQHWYLDYGLPLAGLPLTAGSAWDSPRFALFVDEGKTVYDLLDRYTSLLVQQGLIPDPADKVRFPWHTESLYCTWIDQIYRAGDELAPELQEQAVLNSVTVLDEALVREALEVIDRKRLPFRTILLDEGWEVTRGQWEPHPVRFPDLRRLVDDIHARGLKVIVWWNWAEVFDDAEVNPAHLLAGGRRNKHGSRMRDYSSPLTQSEYLAPLFHRLFSSDPGCYDLDGVKTDFLADKVHADMPVHDPAWRGEENYFFHVTRLFQTRMRDAKPDACHLGCAGHPFLAQFIDVNRTYDVASSDIGEHVGRALMLRHTAPGVPVAFDFHNHLENGDLYFEEAARLGCSVEIGSVLGMDRDRKARWEPADAAYYQMLREGLARLAPLRTRG